MFILRDLAALPNIRPSSSWTAKANRGAMTITGRILGWILPGILCCGGCATPALVETSEADGHVRWRSPTRRGMTRQLRPIARVPEAWPARHSGDRRLAQKRGSRAAGRAIGRGFLNAYAEMNRQAAQSSAGQAPVSQDVEGIPVPATASGCPDSVPSDPSQPQHSGTSRSVASAHAVAEHTIVASGDFRLHRLAGSDTTQIRRSRDCAHARTRRRDGPPSVRIGTRPHVRCRSHGRCRELGGTCAQRPRTSPGTAPNSHPGPHGCARRTIGLPPDQT